MLIFRVYGDGVLLYDSSTMTAATATKSVDVSVVGINELKLVVVDSGDGTFNDHADWAGARLVLASPEMPLFPATPLSALATSLGEHHPYLERYGYQRRGVPSTALDERCRFHRHCDGCRQHHNFRRRNGCPASQIHVSGHCVQRQWGVLTVCSAIAITGVTYLSDLPFVSETNGWGPVERDINNGETESGDGSTITLEGVTYSKGLGVHPMALETDPPSHVVFDLGGQYSRFQSDIGVDDRYGILGSVVFRVYADGVLVFESSLMTGTTATQSIDLDMSGVNELKLVVSPGADGYADDLAVWAGAGLIQQLRDDRLRLRTSGFRVDTGLPFSLPSLSYPGEARHRRRCMANALARFGIEARI